MMARKARSLRGFTLVEMVTVIAITGLIVLLMGYEFDAAINNLLHTRSNRDLEGNARLVMAKVTNRLRTASPWVFNPNAGANGADDVMLNPVPVGTPGATSNVLTFYRVHPGSLANPSGIALSPGGGSPDPPYDKVTIQRSTCPTIGCTDPSPNYLVETAVDASTNSASETPLVLGKDVTSFFVTALGNPKAATVDISLTVTDQSPRCSPKCTYSTSNKILVAGDQVNNE